MRIARTEGHVRASGVRASGVRASGHLVMRSHIEGHEPLEENFRGLVVAEQSISVNVVAALELSNRTKPQRTQNKTHQKKVSPSLRIAFPPC